MSDDLVLPGTAKKAITLIWTKNRDGVWAGPDTSVAYLSKMKRAGVSNVVIVSRVHEYMRQCGNPRPIGLAEFLADVDANPAEFADFLAGIINYGGDEL